MKRVTIFGDMDYDRDSDTMHLGEIAMIGLASVEDAQQLVAAGHAKGWLQPACFTGTLHLMLSTDKHALCVPVDVKQWAADLEEMCP